MRFGLLGCSDIAKRKFIPAIVDSDHGMLSAIASRDIYKAKDFASGKNNCTCYSNYSDLLLSDKVDTVYISTPNGLHKENIIEAANNGKHIICEKSICWDNSDWFEIEQAIIKNNVALLEGFSYIYHSQHMQVKEMIQNGLIGKPRHMAVSFGFPPMRSTHRYDSKLGGGSLLDAGVYGLHLSRFMFGSKITSISPELVYEDQNVDIQGSVMLRFENDAIVNINFGFDFSYKNEYVIWGQKGHIKVNRAFSPPADYEPQIEICKDNELSVKRLSPENQFLNEINYFIENYQNPQIRAIWLKDIHDQAQLLDIIFKTTI